MESGVRPARGTGVVEIYSDFFDEGRHFESSVTADSAGNIDVTVTPKGKYLTATATDPNGNTSAFATFGRINLKATGMEVTQGIQNLNNDVRLIAGRPTWVRLCPE